MNSTHLHLVINHLAVIGTIFGIIALLFAIKANSRATYFAAYTILIIAAAGAIIAYFSGESAEETVEHVSGVAESAIEPHEDSAKFTLIGFVVLAGLAIASAMLMRTKQQLQRKLAMGVLVLSFLTLVLAARTAWLGGKIRHTEVTASQAAPVPSGEDQDDDD